MFGSCPQKIEVLRKQCTIENGKYGISPKEVNADNDAQYTQECISNYEHRHQVERRYYFSFKQESEELANWHFVANALEDIINSQPSNAEQNQSVINGSR